MSLLRTAFRERWPILIVIVGLIVTLEGSVRGTGPTWIDPSAWVVGNALVAASVTTWFVKASPTTRAYALTSLVLFGAVRSIDYLTSGRTAPLGVWLIVTGLVVELAHTKRRLALGGRT